jgi:D-aspartate ligase
VNAVTRATTLTALHDVAAPDLAAQDLAAQDLAAAVDVRPGAVTRPGGRLRIVPPHFSIQIFSELAAVEAEWRQFERTADCTGFQSFDWLAAWQRHVGERRGARPVVAVGRFAQGDIAFIVPLCLMRGYLARRLCWLGQDLCDYNAPLLAPDFSKRTTPEEFLAAWHELQAQMQCEPLLRHDWIEFEKMPETVGAQANPFMHLRVTPNRSNAHLAHLGDDWEKFYRAKRSSATRRRDRSKLRHMSQFGDVRFLTASDDADARRTLEILMEQKGRALARKGVADIFAPPGHREFFLDLASNPQTRHLVHISRIEIGDVCAAANFGVVFGDRYYHVLASYVDSEVAHYGPGALHLRELLAYAIKRGLKCFDFTVGDEQYKFDWCDTVIKLYDYTATTRWRGLPARALSSVQRRSKRLIKQTPLLWKIASHARSAVGAFSRVSRHENDLAAATSARPSPTASACVMGDMDLLRPLALAGVPCAVVSRPGVPSLYSRYAHTRLAWDDYSGETERLLDALVAFGTAQPEPPVLFYQEDGQTLLISRHRERLAKAFRFVVAETDLAEDLLDKARFQKLAERYKLPVPPARRFDPAKIEPAYLGLRFPLILKPLTRLDRWNDALGLRKALCADNLEALRALWPQLGALGLELLAQEFIHGSEARIESYHCYVDQQGRVAGEFTGRKIRTYPLRFGHTTALEITDAADVRSQGRDIVERLSLSGVAKLDFKRDMQGNLRLLEINPRFTLWHHPGALAGVNIPALVYADLTGSPRPAPTRLKAGLRWCRPWKDFPAAREAGEPLFAWARWTIGCQAKSTLSIDDPLPFVRAALYRLAGEGRKSEAIGVWRARKRSDS